MTRQQRRLRQLRPAGTIVEFAIVAPVAMMIAFNCLDLGRIFSDQAIVSGAARQGALVGAASNFDESTRAAWEAAVRGAVLEELASIRHFDESLAKIDIDTEREDAEFFVVKVNVSWPFRPVFPGFVGGGEIFLNEQMVSRRYR